jgi:hypothetical protein
VIIDSASMMVLIFDSGQQVIFSPSKIFLDSKWLQVLGRAI